MAGEAARSADRGGTAVALSLRLPTLRDSSVQVPTAIANFPKELYCAPKAWAAAKYNLKQWSMFQKGKHPQLHRAPLPHSLQLWAWPHGNVSSTAVQFEAVVGILERQAVLLAQPPPAHNTSGMGAVFLGVSAIRADLGSDMHVQQCWVIGTSFDQVIPK